MTKPTEKDREKAENMAVETLAGDMVDRLLTEIQQLEKPWSALSEGKQKALLDRLQGAVAGIVRHAVRLIAAEDHQTLHALVDKVVFKDGVQATLNAVGDRDAAHALADAAGSSVVIIICDPENYMGGLYRDRSDPQQPELPQE